MDHDRQTTQVIYLFSSRPKNRDAKWPPRGDYPPMRMVTPNPTAIPGVLAMAYNANRHADLFLAILEGGEEYSYLSSEFPTRFSNHAGKASAPGTTAQSFLTVFTA